MENFILSEVNREDLQTLVTPDDLLSNNVHNNGGDNLLLIENGELTAMNDNKKSNIFTWSARRSFSFSEFAFPHPLR